MSNQPLSGYVFHIAAMAPAATIVEFLLSDLGARMVRVPADAAADLTELSADSSGGKVVLSPFGARGRFADGPDHDSAVEAVGGALMAQYTYEPGPAYLLTPYATVGQAILAAAALAAQEIARAVHRVPASPLSLSGLQGLFSIQSGTYAFGPKQDPDRWDHTPRGQWATYSTYLAADDWLFIGASTTSFMIKALEALGLGFFLEDPRTHQGPRAIRHTDLDIAIRERIAELVHTRPRDHWLDLLARAGVPAGPVLSIEEALAHPHVAASGLVEPGWPIGRLTRLVDVTRRGDAQPRPLAQLGPVPLSGVRVVELAGYIAGSYVGRLLTDLGAEVVKIEPPDGDPFRMTGYGFTAWNYGKKSVALNLRDPNDRTKLFSLVQEADILVTNYRPEALERMGVGRETLFALNPALIHCTVSAFGETGPLAYLPGFDPIVQGFAGIMRRQGGDGEPVKSQMAATDYLSAMLGTLGILAARAGQLHSGGGYIVKTSLLAAALLLNYTAYEDLRAGRCYLIGGRDYKGPHPLNGLHRARDGWVLTVVPTPTSDAPMVAAVNYLQDEIKNDSVSEAIARLQRFGVPAVPCLDPEQLLAESHFSDNGFWVTIDQPDLGPVTLPAPALGPAHRVDPAPTCGQHNSEIATIWSRQELVPRGA